MRIWAYFSAALIAISILSLVKSPVQAQSGYQTTWAFIGIAHYSGGGEYRLSSTIGKPGQSVSGGNYEMDGGIVFSDNPNKGSVYIPLIMK